MSDRNKGEGGKRPKHPEGTLGIELDALTLSIYPILVLPLSEAQFLSGSSSRSGTRQARKLVLVANYPGAIRVVVEPGGGVSLAQEEGRRHIVCMEATISSANSASRLDEPEIVKVVKTTLERSLLDEGGWLRKNADVRKALGIAVVAVNGLIAVGKKLDDHEAQIAADNHKPKIRPWGCEKPASARN